MTYDMPCKVIMTRDAAAEFVKRALVLVTSLLTQYTV